MKISRTLRSAITRHNRRFADLPVIDGRSLTPENDGDIAELHALRERIYTLLPSADPSAIDRRDAWFDSSSPSPMIILSSWPVDESARMLADWRAELDATRIPS